MLREGLATSVRISPKSWQYEVVDCVILTVAHAVFDKVGLDDLKKIMGNNPILIDVRGIFSRDEAEWKGFYYKAL